jgi:hypothetical protein
MLLLQAAEHEDYFWRAAAKRERKCKEYRQRLRNTFRRSQPLPPTTGNPGRSAHIAVKRRQVDAGNHGIRRFTVFQCIQDDDR